MRYIMAETHQFDLVEACAARDRGIALATLNNQDFLATARSYARQHCRRYGTVTADDVRKAMMKKGYEPASSAAWGGLFRGREWLMVGWTQSDYVTNHGRMNRVWRLKQ